MKKNTEISERISELIDKLSLKPNSFAKLLGYDRSQTIYDIINGKSAPSFDFFKRFQLSEFSEKVNIDWLLTGRGDMLNSYSGLILPNLLEDPGSKYGECLKCRDKDQIIKSRDATIEALQRTIQTQAEYIELLKEVSPGSSSGQKRKAS